jgi:hypothetical protein
LIEALNEHGDFDNIICREEYTSPDEALGLIASVAPPAIAVNFTVVKLMRSSNGVVEVDHKIFSTVWGHTTRPGPIPQGRSRSRAATTRS